MKTLLLALGLTVLISHAAHSQTREETEKWIVETLQANALEYKTRQGLGAEKNSSALTFLTYSDFAFQFEDGYFIIRCKASYAKYMGADAVDKVLMRLPVYDVAIVPAAIREGDDAYNISFKTASAAFPYVNETAAYKEEKWLFNIRVPVAQNEALPQKLREAFARLKQEYGQP
jgi:hypothetical protein